MDRRSERVNWWISFLFDQGERHEILVAFGACFAYVCVLVLEAVGLPTWAAVALVAVLPLFCWLAVKLSRSRDHVLKLDI